MYAAISSTDIVCHQGSSFSSGKPLWRRSSALSFSRPPVPTFLPHEYSAVLQPISVSLLPLPYVLCRPSSVLPLPLTCSFFLFLALLFLPRLPLLLCYFTHFHYVMYILNLNPYDLSAALWHCPTVPIHLSPSPFLLFVTLLSCISSFQSHSYIRQSGPWHPLPDSHCLLQFMRRHLVSRCHPNPSTDLLPPPSRRSCRHSRRLLHVLAYIRLCNNHPFQGSSTNIWATPAISHVPTATTFLVSSRHFTRIMPSSPTSRSGITYH